jgi:hypothetical protein
MKKPLLSRSLLLIAALAAPTFTFGCLLDEAGRAIEEVGDEIEDAGEAAEDAVDD